MLWTIAIILFILWILGFVTFHVFGVYIHVLLVLAIVAVLGLRPLERVLTIVELAPGIAPAELPVDLDASAVHLPIPGSRFASERG